MLAELHASKPSLEASSDASAARALPGQHARHPLHLAVLLGLSSALAFAPDASAGGIVVTNANDSGAGSLRQAIIDANNSAGADTITFDSSVTGTITLTSGGLGVYDDTTISGPGASTLTVSGGGTFGVFQCLAPSASLVALSISGLSITGGTASLGGGVYASNCPLTLDNTVISGNSAAQFGGGVAVFGYDSSLEITNSTISGNAAQGGGGIGAVFIDAPISIVDSTVSNNQALGGGGIFGLYTSGMTLERSTVSGNLAFNGGGMSQYYLYGPLAIQNSTLSGNTAVGGKGGGFGGGVAAAYVYTAGSAVRHSTIAGNYASEYGGGLYLYGGKPEGFTRITLQGVSPQLAKARLQHVGSRRKEAGPKGQGPGFFDIDHSILGDNVSGAGGSSNDIDSSGPVAVSFSLIESLVTRGGIIDDGGNVFGQDPALGPLSDNGGPTLTHLPASNSPAVDSGDPNISDPPATDQRGFARIFGSQIDMGAVEFGATGGSAGEVTFELAAYTIGETEPTKAVALINVMRQGGSAGAVSVNYATSDGTAIAPGDYLPAAGTLNWADGVDGPQSFSLTVNADLLVEGDETFNLTLSDAQGGATLGANSSVTVTIPANGFGGAQSIPAWDWRGLGTALFGVLLAGWLALRGRSQS